MLRHPILDDPQYLQRCPAHRYLWINWESPVPHPYKLDPFHLLMDLRRTTEVLYQGWPLHSQLRVVALLLRHQCL